LLPSEKSARQIPRPGAPAPIPFSYRFDAWLVGKNGLNETRRINAVSSGIWSKAQEVGFMTRLTDLPPAQAKRLAELECPDFDTRPWVSGPPLSQRRVAIVSSAGLVRRGETPFRGRDPDFRVIPTETRPDELLISHISINFDRTGFQEDWNVVFPMDRLSKLASEGAIGSVARTHYSFMGATDPLQMEPYAREVAGRLKADAVDAVILSPV
jgi:D-proline reductase (dithiol) PrdB